MIDVENIGLSLRPINAVSFENVGGKSSGFTYVCPRVALSNRQRYIIIIIIIIVISSAPITIKRT